MKFQTQHAGRAPLDLIGAAEDPERLMQALESFIEYWFGPRRDDYGTSLERLKELELPMPLARLCAFAGQWPADNYWGHLFARQDFLMALEFLELKDDKLVFAWEAQGVCCWATGLDGNDRHVWMKINEDGAPWRLVSESLAKFLVTFCLSEAIFESNYYGHGENLSEVFRSRGELVVPIWEDIGTRGAGEIERYQLAGGRILIRNDNWCATNSDVTAKDYPEFFESRTTSSGWQAPLWEIVDIPQQLRRDILRTFIRKQQRLASEYEDRASHHSRLAEYFQSQLDALPTSEQKT